MKALKKWLLPVLACLIVAGAAALPSRVSQARDARQFGQVHTETLDADSLPIREPPGLLERMELYARWCSREVVPVYITLESSSEELVDQTLGDAVERLTAGLFPEALFQGKVRTLIMSRVLLWDPDSGISQQEPITVWELSAEIDRRSVYLDLDGKTGFPLRFSVYDLNINDWLPPMDLPHELADRYFDLLGIEAEPVSAGSAGNLYGGDWELWYAVSGTDMLCRFYRDGNLLTMSLGVEGAWSGSGQILVADSG